MIRTTASLSPTLLLAVLGIVLPVGAQTLFEVRPVKEQGQLLPGRAFGVADVDLDGDPDLVADDRLYLNDGQGGFTDVSATHMPVGPGSVGQIEPVDVDGDGDPDLLLTQNTGPWYSPQQPRLLINDGSGRFRDATATQMPTTPLGVTTTLTLGDIDGDGDEDLVLGVVALSNGRITYSPQQNLLYRNDGRGTFTDDTATLLPPVADNTATAVCTDLDGDGDSDLVFGNVPNLVSSIATRICLNDGSGRFTDAPSGDLTPNTLWFPWRAIDLDLDGDDDLLTLDVAGYQPNTGTAGLLRNDGSGVFTADASVPISAWRHTAPFDFDGDVLPDLLVGDTVFVNRGAAGFVPLPPPQRIAYAEGAVVAFDPDGDGDQDLLFGSGVLHLKGSDGWFHPRQLPYLPAARSRGEGIAVGDLNGDGRRDLVTGLGTWIHDGTRLRADLTPQISDPWPPTHAVWSNALGDVDGDGDLDLAVTSYYGRHALDCGVFLNDGRGTFTDVSASGRLPVWSYGGCHDVQFVDVEADGDLDLVYASGLGNALFLNDGAGNFTDVTSFALPRGLGPGLEVAVGDVDGDGDPDLVFANGNYGPVPAAENQNRLLLNDGRGNFTDATASHFPGITDTNYCVQLADLDGDGDLDLLFGGTREFSMAGYRQTPDMLWENDGRGVFRDVTAGRMPPAVGSTTSVDVGDVDEDGDLDIVLSRFRGPFVLLNDGAGSFTDGTSAILPGSERFVRTVSLDDLDEDGDLDLTISSVYAFPGLGCAGTCPSGTGLHHYANLTRQLESPQLVVSGGSYELQLVARGAASGQSVVAIPVLAGRTARIPVPSLGTFGLDPSTSIALPALALRQPAGEATLRVSVPIDPSLVNASLHAQALMVQGTGSARLSNVVHDIILR